MMLFAERHNGYKGGVALFFIGVIFFLIGFGSPYWTKATVTVADASGTVFKSHIGLWVSCMSSHSFSLCVSTTSSSSDAGTWYTAVQALQCIALIGFFLAGCYVIVANCIRNDRAFSRVLEVLMAISSVVGLIGACVYGVKQSEARELSEDLAAQRNLGTDIDHVSWAFFVSVIGCVLIIVAAVLVAIFNHRLPADTPAMVFHSPGATLSPGTANGYPYPVVNSPYATAQPGYVPYVTTNSANLPPYYIVGQPAGQPMAAANGMSQPFYGGSQPMGEASLGALGGPPPVVSNEGIAAHGKE